MRKDKIRFEYFLKKVPNLGTFSFLGCLTFCLLPVIKAFAIFVFNDTHGRINQKINKIEK